MNRDELAKADISKIKPAAAAVATPLALGQAAVMRKGQAKAQAERGFITPSGTASRPEPKCLPI